MDARFDMFDNETGSKFVPAWYVMVTAVVALTCILWFRLRYQPASIEENALNNA